MDLIHNLSKLDIETHQQHSSSSSSHEEEVKRNWVELPPDVMSLIFMKLDTIDILGSAQWVCTSWWKLSKQPHLFRSIHVKKVFTLFGHRVPYKSSLELLRRMATEAIDRSCGLVEFSVGDIVTDELLHMLLQYISRKSESLRCVRLLECTEVTDDGLTQLCKQFPQLEELEIIGCQFSEGVFETVGCLCPHLKSFRLNYSLPDGLFNKNRTALAISETMPELRHLNLFGNNLTEYGIRAILCGCPNLQSLDLRRCSNFIFEREIEEIMPANIKLRRPRDSVDESDTAFFPLDYFLEERFNDEEEIDFVYLGRDSP